MIVTNENLASIIPQKDQYIVSSLLKDIEELNDILKMNGRYPICLEYINEHTEYSSERTDPCPDYFGMYRFRVNNSEFEAIGIEMTIEDLDNSVCLLSNFAFAQYVEYPYPISI